MNHIWYLSPSPLEENKSNHGHRLGFVDRITPHLDRCGVSFVVADTDMSPSERASESNTIGADFHLALQVNTSPCIGRSFCTSIYCRKKESGFAQKLAAGLYASRDVAICHDCLVMNISLGELNRAHAQACLIELQIPENQVNITAASIAKAIVSIDGKQWVDEHPFI